MMWLMVAVVCSLNGAQPEVFGYRPVESITSPVDCDGEISWSTADMIIGKGWQPTTYDETLIRELFGEPKQLAPDVFGWAFAHVDAPEFGVLLRPVGRGRVVPGRWDWGSLPLSRRGQGKRMTSRSSSAWLNALAELQREVLQSHEGQ